MSGLLLHLGHDGRTFHGLDPALIFFAALVFAIAVMAIWSGEDSGADAPSDAPVTGGTAWRDGNE
jgi:hypothetical protein